MIWGSVFRSVSNCLRTQSAVVSQNRNKSSSSPHLACSVITVVMQGGNHARYGTRVPGTTRPTAHCVCVANKPHRIVRRFTHGCVGVSGEMKTCRRTSCMAFRWTTKSGLCFWTRWRSADASSQRLENYATQPHKADVTYHDAGFRVCRRASTRLTPSA